MFSFYSLIILRDHPLLIVSIPPLFLVNTVLGHYFYLALQMNQDFHQRAKFLHSIISPTLRYLKKRPFLLDTYSLTFEKHHVTLQLVKRHHIPDGLLCKPSRQVNFNQRLIYWEIRMSTRIDVIQT